jgi:hypothetical protein
MAMPHWELIFAITRVRYLFAARCRVALMSLPADAEPLVTSQFSVYQFHAI